MGRLAAVVRLTVTSIGRGSLGRGSACVLCAVRNTESRLFKQFHLLYRLRLHQLRPQPFLNN